MLGAFVSTIRFSVFLLSCMLFGWGFAAAMTVPSFA
jgi:hypothetical protein